MAGHKLLIKLFDVFEKKGSYLFHFVSFEFCAFNQKKILKLSTACTTLNPQQLSQQ
jgi:hypothetical protein